MLTRPLSLPRFVLSLALVALVGACSDDDPAAPGPQPIVNSDPVVVPLFVQDESGASIDPATVDPITPLYEIRMANPVMGPDGAQLTWADFATVAGTATIECTAAGTSVALEMEGLIPNGLYTIWNVVLQSPGFDGTLDGLLANLTGMGAAGGVEGLDNGFRASSAGRASLSFTTPGGALSTVGTIGNCATEDEFEWHLVGAYHIDDMSHGPMVGPDGTVAEQFGFIFRQ